MSRAFTDAKRPITKKLLQSINFKALLNCIELEKLIMQASVEYQSYKPNSDIVNPEWHSSLELLSR
ncbi:MAG: hypothetical protein C4323_09945 [Mastigocladus sp. ERB_26_2]